MARPRINPLPRKPDAIISTSVMLTVQVRQRLLRASNHNRRSFGHEVLARLEESFAKHPTRELEPAE